MTVDERTASRPVVSRSSLVIDLLVIAILAWITWMNRSDSFDHFQNTDESGYAAQAAYYEAEGWSTFAVPSNATWVTVLYRLAAKIFGPYELAPVRILVWIICCTCGWLIYRLLANYADRWSGFLASLFFVLYNQYIEGRSANREWFSGLFVLLGVAVFLRALEKGLLGRSPKLGVLGAGACFAFAYCVKDQSLPMSLIVPAVLVVRAGRQRQLLENFQLGVWYSAGYALTLVASHVPFLLHGTLSDQLRFTVGWISTYAVKTAAIKAEKSPQTLLIYLSALYFGIYCRGLFAIGYLHGIRSLISWHPFRKSEAGAGDPLANRATMNSLFSLTAVIYLVATMAAVQAGMRFFLHYYLFWLPPATLLLGLAMSDLFRAPTNVVWNLLRSFFFILLWMELLFEPEEFPLSLGVVLVGGAILISGCYILSFSNVFRFSASLPRRDRVIRLATLVGFSGAILLASGTMFVNPPPQPTSIYAEKAGLQLRGMAKPGDRLFVWGWLPEVYEYSRLTPASQFVTCNGLVNDLQPDLASCKLNEQAAKVLFEELERTRPRFILDAAIGSYSSSSAEAYDIYRYPPVVNYLREKYRTAANIHGFVLFERKKTPDNSH